MAALEKQKPAPAYLPTDLARIEVGNLEDHLPRLAECDWVVEVVVENMAVKKALLGDGSPPTSGPTPSSPPTPPACP